MFRIQKASLGNWGAAPGYVWGLIRGLPYRLQKKVPTNEIASIRIRIEFGRTVCCNWGIALGFLEGGSWQSDFEISGECITGW